LAAGARRRDRLDRTLVARILSALVGQSVPTVAGATTEQALEGDDSSGDAAVSQLVERIEFTRLEAGEQLFAQGDDSDAAYVVVSGRLRVDREGPQARLLGEVGRGDVVGEMGLLDNAPRSASVRAVRDSTLARLSLEEFRALIFEKPQMILHFARTVLRRTADRQQRADRATSVAVVITTGDPGSFVEDLTAAIESKGATLRLSAERVDEILERPGIAARATAAAGLPRLSEYLHEMEGRHDHLVYEIDDTDSYWGRLAIRQADRVVVVVSPRPDARETACLEAVRQRLEALSDVPVWYVVVEDASTRVPSASAELRERHRPTELVHVRRDRAADAARVARLVIDRGTGLVLSGGGARGFAHIGVYRALADRGIAVDRVGGTSIGSIMAAGVALDVDPVEFAGHCRDFFRNLMDYTVPLVSLVKGRRISDGLASYFEGWSIEDTWVPYYCVSSDLTKGELHVHRAGPIADAVRASIAIPGLLPPVSVDGHILVDGGVLDNLPVDTMNEQKGISRIIAVDVAPVEGPSALQDYGLHVSATDVVKARLTRTPNPYPALPGVLVRSMLVGAVRDRNRVKESGAIDLYVDLDMPDVGLLDFDRVDPVVDRGYEAGLEALDAWLGTA
jgi:predicted acylesterase/phospholipase RssA/CRP-like cAMP-binding protein